MAEREIGGRGEGEKGRKRLPFSPSPLLLTLPILLLALALRFSGLQWGLPNAEHWYSYHPDERQIALAVSNVANDWNPHFFNYPSLFIFLTYFAYLIQSGLGLQTNVAQPWAPLHDVILCGRIVCALLGAFTVPAVYLIGKRLADEKMALLAAFLLAVAPGHLQHSHFATVDVPATFFVAWSLYFAIRVPDEEGRKTLFIAALLAGLAAATKYNAGLVILAPLLAAIQNSKSKFQNCASVFVFAFLGFVIGCPHSLLSTKEFLGNRTDSGLLFELLVHPKIGQDNIFTNTGNGWIYHLTFNLPFAFTAPGALCAIAGLVFAVRSKNNRWWPLLAFAGVYFFTLGLSQVRFMRYLFPLLPVLCLAVPLCFQLLPKAISKFGAVVLSLLMFIGATNVLYPFCVADPRDQTAAFIKSKTMQPVTVALINRPWFYTPPLWPQDYPPPSQVTSGVSPDGKFRFVVTDFDYSKIGTPWLIDSEFEWRDKDRLNDVSYRKKFLPYDKVNYFQWRFKNFPPFELPGRDFVPHDFLYSNPQIHAYVHF